MKVTGPMRPLLVDNDFSVPGPNKPGTNRYSRLTDYPVPESVGVFNSRRPRSRFLVLANN
jgi:hypothetical protein